MKFSMLVFLADVGFSQSLAGVSDLFMIKVEQTLASIFYTVGATLCTYCTEIKIRELRL